MNHSPQAHTIESHRDQETPSRDVAARFNTAGRKLSRRSFLKAAAGWANAAGVLIASGGTAGCAPTRSTVAAQSEKKVQLVYQDWRTDWFPRLAQNMLEEFQAEHPNIRVFYSIDPPSEVFNERMIADFQSGTAPDVFQGCCGFFPSWFQKGYALDLGPYITDLDKATINDWDPVQYHAFFSQNGNLYGLPKYHGALALYYNKDLFDQYQLEYPDGSWTHDDYLSAMLSIGRKQKNPPAEWGSMVDLAWDRLQVHVNSWGGHFVDPVDSTRSQMSAQPALEALEWLRARMQDDRVMATPLDLQKQSMEEAFIAGKLAMIEDGSWSLKTILTGAPFRIGVAPFPAGPARRATLSSTDGFGIYAGTKHPEAAWELLKFLVSKTYGRKMAKVHYLQPARESLVDEWIGFIRADYPEKAKDMDLAAFADGHRKGYSVVAEIFAHQEQAERIARKAWEDIFLLNQAPVEKMKSASLEIEAAQK